MESEINKEIKKKDQTFVNQIIGGVYISLRRGKKGGPEGWWWNGGKLKGFV